MPDTSGQPSSPQTELEFVWQGFLYFWERELAGALAPGQALAYAGEWGLPADVRPIAGADLFSDVTSIANAVAGAFGGGFGWLSNLLRDIVNGVWQLVSTTWDAGMNVAGRVWDAGQNVAGRVWDAGQSIREVIWAAAGRVADVVWSALSGAGSFLWPPVSWLGGQLWDVLSFVGGNLWTAISFVGGNLWTVLSWLGNQLWTVLSWLGNRIWDGISWAGNQVWSGLTFLGEQAWNAITWLGGKAWDGLVYVGGQVWEGAKWLAEHAWDGAAAIVTFFVTKAFEPFVPSFTYHQGTLRRTLAADYDSAEELFEDRVSHSVGSTIVSFAEDVFGGIAQFWPLFSGIGQVYATDNVQRAMKKLAPTLPTVQYTRDALLRGFIGDGEHDEILGRMGLSGDRIAWLKKLYFDIPTPSALITMAVREVFSPEQRAQLTLDEGFPVDFAFWGHQVGISEEWARNYWAAHWQLPSPSQVYEMFHRGLMDQGEVAGYLKAADYAPVWRDRLRDIAYNVPGRIDLRRMFAAGVFDRGRVHRGYLDLGYNPDDAEALTEFAIRLASGSDKDIPRGVVLKAYRDGVMGREAAAGQLLDQGFDEDAVELMLAMEDLHNAEEDAGLAEDIIEADLKAGAISEDAALSELGALGTPPARAELLVRRWRRRAAVRTATLSASQVQRLLREQLIDEGTARGRLAALSYNEADAGFLIELARPDAAEKDPPELTLAQLRQALNAGLLSEPDYDARLRRKGYADGDVAILNALASPGTPNAEPPELTKADLRALLRGNIIDENEASTRLLAKGYAFDDAALLLDLWTAGRS